MPCLNPENLKERSEKNDSKKAFLNYGEIQGERIIISTVNSHDLAMVVTISSRRDKWERDRKCVKLGVEER